MQEFWKNSQGKDLVQGPFLGKLYLFSTIQAGGNSLKMLKC